MLLCCIVYNGGFKKIVSLFSLLDTSENKCIVPIKDGATFSHWKKSSLWALIVLKAEKKIFVLKKQGICVDKALEKGFLN